MMKDDLFEVIEPELDESDVVELLDENGVPTLFNIIANLELDGQEYAILSNVDDDEDVLIFRVTEENEEFVFETIEEEEELNAVIDAYNELLDEEGLEE
ncbi:MAG TPA: DUF1292 domain-containing protein [Clostridiales bacterium UBA8960]|jgi:uncharacterized protein YrzB (UPF0473 family)|nr:DUF1292 domain-containing protein [Clostridiales bacterium UBA8960]